MRLSLTKKSIAAILLGIVFLLGGAMTVFATTDAEAAKESEDAVMKQLICNPLPWGEGTFAACIPETVYYAFYKPASWLMVGGAYVFDAVLTLSIDSKFILQPFIDTSWKVIRDFSNMAFIFILLYTGISTMLGSGNWRKTVLNVIVIALLINFSLFFTKVVIDAGNILAVGIYTAMGDVKTGSDIHITGGTDRLEERNISFALTRSFQPQSFMNVAGGVVPLDAMIVFIVAGIVSAFAGYIFFKAALLFIGRLIGFWFLMIISPLAFISVTFPKGNKFQEWLDALLNQAFVAPVFLFLVYLIMKVVNSHILDALTKAPPPTAGLATFGFQKVLLPVIVATLIIMALKSALDYAEKTAGAFGKLGAQMASVAMTGTMGVTAIAGRQIVGRLAARQLRNTPAKTEEEIAGMSTFDRGRYKANRALALKASTASFDVRNFGDKNSLISKTISGKVFQKEQGVGGREKVAKEKEKKATDNVPELSIFEKQGIRERAEEKARNEASEAEGALASAVFEEKSATEDVTAQMQAYAEAQRLHAEAAKDVFAATTAYEEAVRDRMRGGTQQAVDNALANLNKAKSDYSSSPTAVAVTASLDNLHAAENAKRKAIESVVAATKAMDEASKPERAEAIAKDEIDAVNKQRRAKWAKAVAEKGNHAAADKIRKGEESGNAKKLKELAKDKKKEEEGENRPDVIKHIEEKIEETKGNK